MSDPSIPIDPISIIYLLQNVSMPEKTKKNYRISKQHFFVWMGGGQVKAESIHLY